MNIAPARLFALVILLLPTLLFAECVVVEADPPEVPRNVTVHLEYSGKPLQMPVSVVEAATRKVVREVTTDANGKAEIHDLTPGLYEIRSLVAEVTLIKVLAKEGNYEVDIAATFDQAPIALMKVRGTITDVTGAAIPGALAVVEEIDPLHRPVDLGKSDEHGRISLIVPAGLYEMRVASQGFQTAAFPVRVTDNGWESFRLTLQVGAADCAAPPRSVTIREGGSGTDPNL